MDASIPPYEIRLMQEEDIPQALGLWKEAGMTQGIGTVKTWWKVDPEGIYVAATRDDDLLGVCSGVFSIEGVAFIGLYAVRTYLRGRGVGMQLFNAVMKHVGDRNCGLNGVATHMAHYRDRSGFGFIPGWIALVYRKRNVDISPLLKTYGDVIVRQYEKNLFDKIVDYDAMVLGTRREKVLRINIEEEGDNLTMVAMSQDSVCGYGIIKRDVFEFGLIGPLYADNTETAEVLIRNLVENFPQARDNGLFLMSLENNQGSVDIAQKLQMKQVDRVTRQYLKEIAPVDMDKIFSHHDLNFTSF